MRYKIHRQWWIVCLIIGLWIGAVSVGAQTDSFPSDTPLFADDFSGTGSQWMTASASHFSNDDDNLFYYVIDGQQRYITHLGAASDAVQLTFDMRIRYSSGAIAQISLIEEFADVDDTTHQTGGFHLRLARRLVAGDDIIAPYITYTQQSPVDLYNSNDPATYLTPGTVTDDHTIRLSIQGTNWHLSAYAGDRVIDRISGTLPQPHSAYRWLMIHGDNNGRSIQSGYLDNLVVHGTARTVTSQVNNPGASTLQPDRIAAPISIQTINNPAARTTADLPSPVAPPDNIATAPPERPAGSLYQYSIPFTLRLDELSLNFLFSSSAD
jgi:hypothetical protein